MNQQKVIKTYESQIEQHLIEDIRQDFEQEIYEINCRISPVYANQLNTYPQQHSNPFSQHYYFFSSENLAKQFIKDNCINTAIKEVEWIKEMMSQIKHSKNRLSSLLSEVYNSESDKLVLPLYKYGCISNAQLLSDIVNNYADKNAYTDEELSLCLHNLCNKDVIQEYRRPESNLKFNEDNQ